MRLSNQSSYLPFLAAFTTIILWSFAFPASRAAVDYFTAEQIVLLRYIIACLFYFVLFCLGMFRLPKLEDMPLLIFLSLMGITIYQILFVIGMSKVAGAAAGMIITTNPLITSLLARFFLSERLTIMTWAGIVISTIGVAIISLIKGADGEPLGYLALMIAVTAIACYFVFQKPLLKKYTPLGITSYTSVIGTIPFLYFLPDLPQALLDSPLSPSLWIVAMGVFSSGIGFLLWIYALSKLPVGVVTSFLFLQPIAVGIMSWLWLNEIPEVKTFLGSIIVLAGLSLIVRDQFKKAQEQRTKISNYQKNS